MVKVIHLTSVHPYNDTRIFHKECKTLVKEGYNVILIVPHDCDETVDGVKIRAAPKPKGRLSRMTRTVWQIYKSAIAERAKVYHFHDLELVGVGLLLKLITRATVIYDVHEYNPDAIRGRTWIPAPLRLMLSKIFDWLEIFTAQVFDVIITADNDIAQRFRGRKFNVITLFNFPIKELYSQHTHLRSYSDFGARRVTLVYVGVMGRSRGLWLMLEAMEILLNEYQMDVELVLAGRIHDNNEQSRFEYYVNHRLLLSERVHWLGRIPQSQVADVLANSHIGWVPLASIPKFRKNIPTKQFEYMASGLPIVGSDLPPIRCFVETAQAGRLATPDDAHSHAKEVAYLVQHPGIARQMGENGRRAFVTQYNWDSEAKKLIELYNDLME